MCRLRAATGLPARSDDSDRDGRAALPAGENRFDVVLDVTPHEVEPLAHLGNILVFLDDACSDVSGFDGNRRGAQLSDDATSRRLQLGAQLARSPSSIVAAQAATDVSRRLIFQTCSSRSRSRCMSASRVSLPVDIASPQKSTRTPIVKIMPSPRALREDGTRISRHGHSSMHFQICARVGALRFPRFDLWSESCSASRA